MKNKKAFTVVELVIVIAIIAILAAVLIPTFANIIKKANTSKDNQLIRNLNTALAASRAENNNEPHANMTEALAAAEKFGYEVDKINASGTDAEILWDSQNDLFCYFDGSEIKYIPESELTYTKDNADPEKKIYDVDYWVIRKDVTNTAADNRGEGEHQISAMYSTYLAGLAGNDATIVITKGLDVGNNVISAIKYNDTTDQKVTIRTNGGELIVDAKDGTVKHYGNADSVNIVKIATSSYHEFGTVPFIQISEGRLEIEAGADVNGIHVANVQVYNESTGEYDKTEKTFSSNVTLTLNGANVKLSRDPISLNLSEAVLVCEVQADANSASEFIWLVGNGTLDDAKVVVTPTNVYDASKTVTNATASEAAKAIANYLDGSDVKDGGKSAQEAEAASALKGSGTADDPFLIYDYATMQKISDFYDLGYYYFAVDLGRTDNGKIDCTGWIPVNINGSFNGNNVKFMNVDNRLFLNIGAKGIDGDVGSWSTTPATIENFDAYFKLEGDMDAAGGMAKQILGNNTTTLSKINIYGQIVSGSNSGALFSYTTGNPYDKNQNVAQTILVNDCYIYATLVSTSSSVAVVSGYPNYCNPNLVLTINNPDTIWQGSASNPSGKIKFVTMSSWTIPEGGTANKTIDCTKLNTVSLTKESDESYIVGKSTNAVTVKSYISAQLTETDSNGNKTAVAGITMAVQYLGEYDLDTTTKVLDGFSSFEFHNKAKESSATILNNKMIVNVAGTNNYTFGEIKLVVIECDSNGNVLSYQVKNIVEKTINGSWTIE